MKHFTYYPQIEYGGVLMTNLMVRAKIRDAIKNNTYTYYKYKVTDADRPDILADKYYGNPNYTWAIFYANDIMDPLTDWPLTQNQFNRYMIEKYGSIEISMITPHHYLLDDQYVIDELSFLDPLLYAAKRKKIITNYRYEQQLNDAKRDIKIVDSIYIQQLTNELVNIFKS